MNSHSNTEHSVDGGRGQWLTTSAAAAWLGVSPKTVRRRIERGELEARKSSRDGGGVAWLVLVAGQTDGVAPSSTDISTPTDRTSQRTLNGQQGAHAERVTDSSKDISMDKGVERNGHLIGHSTPTNQDSERVSDLRDEVKFLRGVIEQLQRDGAETRAALRKALDGTPKQITAGDGATIATDAPGRAPDAATPKQSPVDASAQQRPAGGRKPASSATLTYNDIADQLEAELRERGL